MSIILRTNKGQALTYDEMDRNQSQFFYSSSLHSSGAKLRLHYTGSDNLDTATEDYGPTRYHEINLQVESEGSSDTAEAAGDSTQIQFNTDDAFDADPLFTFIKEKNYLGIGQAIPIDRLHIKADQFYRAGITLDSISTADTITSKTSIIDFREDSTNVGRLGKTRSDNYNLYLANVYNVDASTNEYGKIHISIGSNGDDNDIVVGTFARTVSGASRSIGAAVFGVGTRNPNRLGTFVGSQGIGISRNSADTEQSAIIPLEGSAIFNQTDSSGQYRLVPNFSHPTGLLIHTPRTSNGGSVVVAINSDSTDKNEAFSIINAEGGSYANSEVIASFQASGKVGINTNKPQDVGLTVAGNISGSGTLQVETLNDDATSYSDLTAIGATSTGLVKKIAAVAAPVPVGGIVIWSGASNAIPQGWALCDGSTANGQVTPNLVNRFVVGATDSYSVGASGGSADAVVVSHTHTATVTDPGHTHSFTQENTRGTGASGAQNGESSFSTVNTNSSTTGISVSNSTTGESGTNKNLPPYYALCYIMYVGYSV